MWESDKEVMYNMTDSLISPESLAMLAGTQVVTGAKPAHKKEVLTLGATGTATLTETPVVATATPMFVFETQEGYDIGTELALTTGYTIAGKVITVVDGVAGDKIIVDYYYTSGTATQSITIEVDKFPGYYMLEAETLWTRETDGALLPALFTMPKIKFASAFSIENAATGDPATFDFNCECFPDSDNKMVVIDIIQ